MKSNGTFPPTSIYFKLLSWPFFNYQYSVTIKADFKLTGDFEFYIGPAFQESEIRKKVFSEF